MEATILPFVVDSKGLDLNRLRQNDKEYHFRGHKLIKRDIPLPEGYSVYVRDEPIEKLSLFEEDGVQENIAIIKMKEMCDLMK